MTATAIMAALLEKKRDLNDSTVSDEEGAWRDEPRDFEEPPDNADPVLSDRLIEPVREGVFERAIEPVLERDVEPVLEGWDEGLRVVDLACEESLREASRAAFLRYVCLSSAMP